MAAPRFKAPNNDFFSELKNRINDHFEQKGINPTGNSKLFTKAIILVVSMVALYVHLVFLTPPVWLAVLECIALGVVGASIGFNIMHDGAHGSFSDRKWLNNLAGLSLNMLGGNVFMWNTKHNVIHHTYTNVDGVDDDLDARPFLRLCESQKKYKLHRFQHFYFWAIYAFLYLYWIGYSDFHKYFTGKIGDFKIAKIKRSEHISFWGFKLAFVAIFVAVPIFMVGFVSWLVGFLIFTMSTGLVMSVVFQLAHTVGETHFPLPEEKTNKIEEAWAIHQLKTTANFATNNKIVSWFSGGLNFQIEHHLFPKISHVHYPEISKIIKKACQDYGVEYIEFPKLRSAIYSHIMHLRNLALAS
ncbi:fatty acid desaturase family protein [Adhaeribacter terreus]|uniref:Fatty acid desaturase family protein n=1 Tax=Adhaeribacter terreus TaxID=529703 RepID=A0ABW0E7H8_9BACT